MSPPRASGRQDVLTDTFSVTGPMPAERTTTVLEASAGTGKTYTIASLTVRYLAEGLVSLPDMMLVTFGRMASQELRDRVRARIAEVEQALGHPSAAAESPDPIVALLASEPDQIEIRRARLAAALASFDEATIATTHSFCQRMLGRLGIAADTEPDATLAEGGMDLLNQVARDVYLARYATDPAPPLNLDDAQRIAAHAVGLPRATLQPVDADPRSEAGHRVAFAAAVREAFDLRKRRERLLDFDDLQLRLAQALSDPVTGAVARRTLQSAYHVVLIDEFQDTDPVQWEILRAAFHRACTLVLIGDPKQAIYAFRGADVFTYLAAAGTAQRHATLGTNWRSDRQLVDALDSLWGGKALGDDRITVHGVQAHHQQGRISVPGQPAVIRLRQLRRHQVPQTNSGLAATGEARAAVVADLAVEVVQLLQSGATITVPGANGPTRRALSPSDIAVLVHTNKKGTMVRDALRAVGVPVVLTATSSVFATTAAQHWLTLLTALEAPNRSGLARAAALTPFLGWTPEQLATAGDAELGELGDQIRDWARRFAAGGMAELLETVTVHGDLAARLLARPDGERLLTDLRHVAHALHAQARQEHLGPAAITERLRRRIEQATSHEATDELSRRLASEHAAVQVITVHRSKGLEFGVVLVPFAWDRHLKDDPDPLRLHDSDGRQVLDVGGPDGAGYRQRREVHLAEDLGEDLRVMYVAFTRARSLLVLWWAPTHNSRQAPLSRLLLAPDRTAAQLPMKVEIGTDEAVAERFAALAAGTEAISIEGCEPRRSAGFVPAGEHHGELTARPFTRQLDMSFHRTSYSRLTRDAHDELLAVASLTAESGSDDAVDEPAALGGPGPITSGSEPESFGVQDEPLGAVRVDPIGLAPVGLSAIGRAAPTPGAGAADGAVAGAGAADGAGGAGGAGGTDTAEATLKAVLSPMRELPGGTGFGTVVHEILEYLDTDGPDLPRQVRDHVDKALAWQGDRPELDPQTLAAALTDVFATPLGPLAADRTLADFRPADRLAELEFELPLAGGDLIGDTAVASTLGAVAEALADTLPADDPLIAYPHLLRDNVIAEQELRGYLTGSIDAVLRPSADRHGGESGGSGDRADRYLVVDYKTNKLGDYVQPLSAWDYRPDAMAQAMMASHYPLQALLYQVALHRYLRWRIPGYRPETHLGGVLYLFVRGMSGPDTPRVNGVPCGVFSWQPPPELVLATSDILAGREGS